MSSLIWLIAIIFLQTCKSKTKATFIVNSLLIVNVGNLRPVLMTTFATTVKLDNFFFAFTLKFYFICSPRPFFVKYLLILKSYLFCGHVNQSNGSLFTYAMLWPKLWPLFLAVNTNKKIEFGIWNWKFIV